MRKYLAMSFWGGFGLYYLGSIMSIFKQLFRVVVHYICINLYIVRIFLIGDNALFSLFSLLSIGIEISMYIIVISHTIV